MTAAAPGRGDLMRLSVVFALFTGLGENAARTAAMMFDRPWDHGIHVWWMAPVGEFMLFALVAILILVASSVAPAIRQPKVVFSIFAAQALFTLSLFVSGVHVAAMLLLVVGIAVQLGSWVGKRPTLFKRLLSIGLTTSLAVTAVISACVIGWASVVEWRASRAVTQSAPGAPNVLLLIWDTVRASSLSLYGYQRQTTPNLDSLAKSGVTFERAIATASYTLPSHASIFTGRWAHQLAVDWRVPLEDSVPTLAEVLRSAGYRTAGFSANRAYVTRAWGLGRGFDSFDEHRLGWQQVVRSTSLVRFLVTRELVRRLFGLDDDLARVHADDNARALLAWLGRGGSRPYFAFVNFMDAHAPYIASAPYDTIFLPPNDGGPRGRREIRRLSRQDPHELPRADALMLQSLYDGAITGLDAAVDRLLDEMRQRGLLENTILIIAGDHGEEWGEHGIFDHGNSLYFRSLNVPLMIVYPRRVPQGRRVSNVVSLRDIAATVLDLAAMPPGLPGRSLRTLWEGETVADSAIAFSFIGGHPGLPPVAKSRTGDMASAVDSVMHVIRNPDGSIEAFDVSRAWRGVLPVSLAPAAAEPLARRLGSIRR